jgi:hypothetical protein
MLREAGIEEIPLASAIDLLVIGVFGINCNRDIKCEQQKWDKM